MDIEDLRSQARRGESLSYVFFWGHTERPGGRLSASCLSQWFPSQFVVASVRYPSAEHWMMAEKARLFGFDIVVAGNEHKFGQNGELATFLHSTGSKILVEASPMDRIWGIGLAKDAPEALDPVRWRGLNLLGFALMEAGDRLAAQGRRGDP